VERSIELSGTIPVGYDEAVALLLAQPGAVVQSPMALGVGAVRREVVVTIDELLVRGDRATLPLEWHAADHAPLFPTFLGELVAEPSVAGTRLTLSGSYWVPLGRVGRFGDGVIGHRIACDAVRTVLDAFGQRLEQLDTLAHRATG
jgi:hypothetical protein